MDYTAQAIFKTNFHTSVYGSEWKLGKQSAVMISNDLQVNGLKYSKITGIFL